LRGAGVASWFSLTLAAVAVLGLALMIILAW
jgi:hypothetical protein